ncbi:RNA polymerase sigma factor [Flavitalea flava]
MEKLYYDPALLVQIANGDERAFKLVFESTYPTVYKAALLVTASTHLAEEVVQDVFIKVWIKRNDLPAISDFKSYLFIMARNQAYKALRRQLRWQDLNKKVSDDVEIQLDSLGEGWEADNILEVYEKAVNQLPAQQQKVFRLSKQQHLTREQVALAMNISPETVKKYLAMAILNIRAYCVIHAPELLPSFLILSVIHSI